MATREVHLPLPPNLVHVSVFLWISFVVSLIAQCEEPKTYTANYKLKAVYVGTSEVDLLLKLRNPYDFPVKILWTRTSCSCMKPDIEGPKILQPFEYRSMRMTIEVPKRETVLNFQVSVFGIPENEQLPDNSKLSDALEISRLQGRLQVLEPIVLTTREGRLEVRGSSSPPEFLLENRTAENWNSVEVRTSVQGVSVDCVLVPESSMEQFRCTVNGLKEYLAKAERPESIEFTVYQQLSTNSFDETVSQQVLRKAVPISYLPDYRLIPKQLLLSSSRNVASIVIDCSKGDARQLVEEVSVLLSSGVSLQRNLWKAKALSDNWIRIELTDDDTNTLKDVNSLTVSIPKVFFKEVLSIKRRR